MSKGISMWAWKLLYWVTILETGVFIAVTLDQIISQGRGLISQGRGSVIAIGIGLTITGIGLIAVVRKIVEEQENG